MKETGILFSSPMVRAILDGRKTQTRRVVKPQPSTKPGLVDQYVSRHIWVDEANFTTPVTVWSCPYGQPGDRLWVRETWADEGDFTKHARLGHNGIRYAADGGHALDCNKGSVWSDCWRPSIHMPRWASRITLEVVSVRVERVHEISESDAMAEGCDHTGLNNLSADEIESAKEQYVRLWDSLNSARGYGWSVNPWVWVVTFKRIEG